MSQPEWIYIFNTRNTSSGLRYVKAQVNNINGVVLLPDNWNASIYGFNYANNGYASFSSNVINVSQWMTLENAGAVFLPASGMRWETTIVALGTSGNYWSTTADEESGACLLYFEENYVLLFQGSGYFAHTRYQGHSVRLVKNF